MFSLQSEKQFFSPCNKTLFLPGRKINGPRKTISCGKKHIKKNFLKENIPMALENISVSVLTRHVSWARVQQKHGFPPHNDRDDPYHRLVKRWPVTFR